MPTIGHWEYDFEYTWSIFGNLTSTTQDLTGLADDVVFSYAYDVLGRKTSVSAAIGSNDDYVNVYSYDNRGRITQITQDGVSGGNAVAEKRVDFGYSDDGTRASISRFADLAGTKAVAETEQVYDLLRRVTDIVHERAATEFADYDLAWDAAGRISDFDFESLVGDDGVGDYSYDDANQLTGADYDFQTDETYTYDSNGNRTISGYATGDHNRLTSDGTWNYTYDSEGNVLSKTNISTSQSIEYTWDHRNRLVKVTFKSAGATPTKIVEYAYDHGQCWVRKTLDTNADGTIEESRMFVHDDGQIVLDFEKTGTSAASNSDLAHRYLWGNSVDQLLADEAVDDGSEEDVAYVLTDHLNSVRDLVAYDPISGTVSVVKHVTFDAFGNVTSDSAPTVLTLFRYTARPFDVDAGIQNNLNRWYDLATGRWMSVDPIGFLAGDVNLYRYAKNRLTIRTDPDGLQDGCPVCQAPMVPVEPTPWVPVEPRPIVQPGLPTNPGQPAGGGASVHISPVGPPVLGTQYYHSCIQIEKDETRPIETCTPKQVWTQLTSGSNYYDACGRLWHTPAQFGLMTVWERHVTWKLVRVTYAIELKMRPVSGIGGPPDGSEVIGSGPVGGGVVGDLPFSSWSIVIREGKCKGPGTPITPPPGTSQSQLVQAIIAAAHQVGQSTNGYQYHLDGPGNTCNSVTWQILTGSGASGTMPVPANQLPGWGSCFGPKKQ